MRVSGRSGQLPYLFMYTPQWQVPVKERMTDLMLYCFRCTDHNRLVSWLLVLNAVSAANVLSQPKILFWAVKFLSSNTCLSLMLLACLYRISLSDWLTIWRFHWTSIGLPFLWCSTISILLVKISHNYSYFSGMVCMLMWYSCTSITKISISMSK